jgi:hypothetical protein
MYCQWWINRWFGFRIELDRYPFRGAAPPNEILSNVNRRSSPRGVGLRGELPKHLARGFPPEQSRLSSRTCFKFDARACLGRCACLFRYLIHTCYYKTPNNVTNRLLAPYPRYSNRPPGKAERSRKSGPQATIVSGTNLRPNCRVGPCSERQLNLQL